MAMHRALAQRLGVAGALVGVACGSPRQSGDSAETGLPSDATVGGSGAATAPTGAASSGEDGSQDGSESGAPRLDVSNDTDVPTGSCKVIGDMDAIGPCRDQAPPDSFDLDTQWTWEGDGAFDQAVAVPLVANLTDDNDDGSIDLCDVPDIVVQLFDGRRDPGKLAAVSGEDGAVHWVADELIGPIASAALGDIDGDGLVEIVTTDAMAHLRAFEHDGTLKWTSSSELEAREAYNGALAMADVDNDGDVEILQGSTLWDHEGNRVTVFADKAEFFVNASVMADLDGDGDQEIIIGRSAYHHDGSVHFSNTDIYSSGGSGIPQVADLDDDPEPEVLLHARDGFTVFEHDGTVKFKGQKPADIPGNVGSNGWVRPSAIVDVDGDDDPEIAVSSGGAFGVHHTDLSSLWVNSVMDSSGAATGTAFDFLGDGSAEAMYGDEHNLYVYDTDGTVLLMAPRSSKTSIEYPVVADVDNDGSAEIVVTSEERQMVRTAPTVQVLRDVEDRWVPARRIWNQHSYHVTNVREDGTIPQFESPHWETLNTFRQNAQIEVGGGTCKPTVG